MELLYRVVGWGDVWQRYVVQYGNKLYLVDIDDDRTGVNVMMDDGSVWMWYWLKVSGEEYFTAEIRIGDVYETDPIIFHDDEGVNVDVFLDMVVRLLNEGVIVDEREGDEE